MHDEAKEGGEGRRSGASGGVVNDGQGLTRRWGGEDEVCLDASVRVMPPSLPI